MNNGKNKRFRELLEGPEAIVVPVCYDAISARLIQKAGFDMVAMGGNGTMSSLIGYPDMGLATATEMIGRARLLAARLDIPMYCDADTGYGGLVNIRRTVRDYEAAGVSGIHIEDQTSPKRCGSMEGVTVVEAEEAVNKLKIALKSRIDPDFVVIGRTDARTSLGLEESIRRCKMFADVGADLVMPCGIQGVADLEIISKELCDKGYKVVADIHEECPEEAISDDVARQLGFKIITRGTTTMQYLCRAMGDYFEEYRRTGDTKRFLEYGVELRDYERLMGFDEENNILDWLKD